MNQQDINKTFITTIRQRAKPKKESVTVGATLLVIVLSLGWWLIASDYSDDAIAGTYQIGSGENSYSLILRPDHTFDESLNRSGKIEHVAGTWRTFGEGHISFSKEFSTAAGQERSSNDEVYASSQRKLGLFLVIVFNPDPGGPVYHKKLFS